MTKREGNNTDSRRWRVEEYEKVATLLDECFQSAIEAHLAMGGRELTNDDCKHIAKGGVFRLLPEAVPVALYYVLRFFLQEADRYVSSVELELGLELFIEFLDICEHGARLDFMRDALDDENLSLDALQNMSLVKQAGDNWPEMAMTLDNETASQIRAAKAKQVEQISPKQAMAISAWLEFMQNRCVNDRSLNAYIEGALRYWREKYGSDTGG